MMDRSKGERLHRSEMHQLDHGFGGGWFGNITLVKTEARQKTLARAVVKAANQLELSEGEFALWLNAKDARWFIEDSGWFHKKSTAKQMLAAAKKSMEDALPKLEAEVEREARRAAFLGER